MSSRYPILPKVSEPPDPLTWPEFGTRERRGHTVSCNRHHVGECLTEKDNWRIIKCDNCVLIHAVPLPEQEELSEYYSQKFYGMSHPDYIERYEKDRTWWDMHHAWNLNSARKHSAGGKLPSSVIDIGCGPCLFLNTARRMGIKTFGLEPDKQLVERAQQLGHVAYCGGVDNIGMLSDFWLLKAFRGEVESDSYRFFELYEVLEHLRNPEKSLVMIHEAMDSDDLLHITVPNDFNPLQIAAMNKYNSSANHLDPWWVAPPEHLNYFTPVSLKLMLRRCGFKVLEMRGTFPMETFLFDPSDKVCPFPNILDSPRMYVGNDEIGRICHQSRMDYELDSADNLSVLMWLYEDNLYQYRIGREISVLAARAF